MNDESELERANMMQPVMHRRSNTHTLVIGLGNPVLGDDGVGWHIARQVRKMTCEDHRFDCVDVAYLSVGGLSLMETMIGTRRAIIADAIMRDDLPPGTLWIGRLDDLSDHGLGHFTSAHDVSLPVALELGRRLGAPLPEEIFVIGVVVEASNVLCDHLTPTVAAVVANGAKLVIALLEGCHLPSSFALAGDKTPQPAHAG